MYDHTIGPLHRSEFPWLQRHAVLNLGIFTLIGLVFRKNLIQYFNTQLGRSHAILWRSAGYLNLYKHLHCWCQVDNKMVKMCMIPFTKWSDMKWQCILSILITNNVSSSSERTAIIMYHMSRSTSSLEVEFPFLPIHHPKNWSFEARHLRTRRRRVPC